MNSATTNGDNAASGGGPREACSGILMSSTPAVSSGHRPSLAETDSEPLGLPVNVVFFDGVCGLCNHFVNFVLSRDRRKTIRFAPLQGETAKQCHATTDESFDTFVWRDRSGNQFLRSAAAVRVLWQLGGIWKCFATLLWLIPLPLRDVGYRLVAANRYRLFGRKETCRLPTAAERGQFLD